MHTSGRGSCLNADSDCAGLGGRVSAFPARCWSEEKAGSGQVSLKHEEARLVLEGAGEQGPPLSSFVLRLQQRFLEDAALIQRFLTPRS